MRRLMIVTFLLCSMPVYAVPVSNGLVGYWAGDGNPNDGSGAGNHGAVAGGVGYTSGKVGQPFELDGVDDWIGTNLTLADDASHSISVWVNWDGENSQFHQEIISWWDTNELPVEGRMFLGTTQAGHLVGPTRFGDGWLDIPVSLATDQWVHIVATYESTTNDRSLYFDGQLIADKAATASAVFAPSMAIGRQGNATTAGEYWDGSIDELAIYNRVLNSRP